MVRIDKLDIQDRNPLYMSSHPLDGVEQTSRFQTRLDEFIFTLGSMNIRLVTVLLPTPEMDRTYGGIDLLKTYRNAGLDVIHYPLENFSTPDSMEPFDLLMDQLSERLISESILIHCQTGCGRTAVVAAGVLIKLGESAPKAISRVHEARPSLKPTINQIHFLRNYSKNPAA